MAKMERVRLGLIGYGMGKIYAAAFQSIPNYYSFLPPIDLVAVATASDESGKKAIADFGFKWQTSDYREILDSDDVNVVLISSPNDLHHQMMLEALRSDKAIYIDKPLACNLEEAQEILKVAQQTSRDAQMIFEFRYCPAIQYAYKLINEGKLGDIYAFRAQHFRSSYVDPEKPLRWKGSLKRSGGGVLPDYSAHSIDLLIWLLGQPKRLTAQFRTFIEERPAVKAGKEKTPIDTEDHAIVLAELPDGAIGTIEAGRLIVGATNEFNIEIYGSKGSIKWEAMNPNYLHFAEMDISEGDQSWRSIPTVQQYPDTTLPISGMTVGMMRFIIAGIADFIQRTLNDEPYNPGLEQGYRVQAVLEAAATAAKNHTWLDVQQL
jgi:predicted dehydrogenase